MPAEVHARPWRAGGSTARISGWLEAAGGCGRQDPEEDEGRREPEEGSLPEEAVVEPQHELAAEVSSGRLRHQLRRGRDY